MRERRSLSEPGLWAFFVVACLCMVVHNGARAALPSDGKTLPETARPGGFSGERALTYLRAQCAFGPRVPGTRAHEDCADYLKRELSKWADEVQEQRFLAAVGQANIALTNLIAVIRPSKAGTQSPPSPPATWAMVCAHWDSRPTADQEADAASRAHPVPGANDGASGTAVVLELARALASARPPCAVLLVLFDGEDYGPGVDRMFLGSRHFAKEYHGPRPAWGVLLDMVGGRNLEISREGYSRERAPSVVRRIWSVAGALKARAFVDRDGDRLMDDHLPLLDAGIPCINLVDMSYPYWHTVSDTPDKCSPASLQSVGDVLLAALLGAQTEASPVR